MRKHLARVLVALVLTAFATAAVAQDVVMLPSRELPMMMLFPDAMTTTLSKTQQTMSVDGIETLKALESFSPRAYRDGPGYSIGYGFQTWQGRRVTRRYPGKVTQEQAERELYEQLPVYEQIVRDMVWKDVRQELFDAFVSIAFNLGRVNDAILAKLDREVPITVRDFLTTARYRGRVSWQLQGRRTREFLMALGDYEEARNIPATRSAVRVAVQNLSRHRLED